MKWWRELVDRWRRGPELRLLEAELKAARQGYEDRREERDQARQQVRLYSAFLRSGLKARCAGGCGDLTFDWSVHLVTDSTGSALVALCRSCLRRLGADAAAKSNGADVAEANPE